MTTENHKAAREIIINDTGIRYPDYTEMDGQDILDETGNKIIDETGNNIQGEPSH